MNVHEYRFLLSERAALEKLIGDTSPENVIGRMSLEHRLQDVVTQLDACGDCSPHVMDARLTFSGKPVYGSRGVSLDFASEAGSAFQAAVTAVGAGSRATLPSSGKIPDSEDFRLMVTGTVPGSFGFQVEDSSQQLRLANESSPVELAIARVQSILAASLGTDEQLADAVADIDPRGIEALSNFLKTMADGDAVCVLGFKDNEFRFRDPDQVRRSQGRLSRDILENDVILTGYFVGFLPGALRAEFLVNGIEETEASFPKEIIGKVISGKVEPAVAQHVNINQTLGETVRVGVHARRVGPLQPRFTFTACEAAYHME